MKRLNNFFLLWAGFFLFAGCSTTKVNLYDYKDVSSVSAVDEGKANYRVVRPKLDPNIMIDANGWEDFGVTIRDYFLSCNDQEKIFQLDQNGSYRLKLTLHNISSDQQFTPSRFVAVKRKVKTDKGIVIKDESYHTDPYWTYTVQTAATAELTAPNGEKRFYDADDSSSYTITGRFFTGIYRSRYVWSLQETLSNLLKQIANDTAPEALIISKKVSLKDDDDFIFLINMGSAEGLREGQKLLVYKGLAFKDEIGAKTITDNVPIGTATVSNQVMPHHAWMIMDDGEHNSVIEVGDSVRPRY